MKRRLFLGAAAGVPALAMGMHPKLKPILFGSRPYSGVIRVATFGDSRSDPAGGSGGPNLYDGINRDFGSSFANNSSAIGRLTTFMRDAVLVANGGVGGETTVGWNGSRTFGRTFAAITALSWEVIVIQYGTNDVNTVTSTATRDSVATSAVTNLQALITALIRTGRKIVFQTVIQRSDSTGANAYGAANAVNRRDCCDYINYGNGGAITGMVPWIQALPQYNSQVFVHDVSTLMNVGGVQTGAYLDTTWASDGCHPSGNGSRRLCASLATLLRTIFADRGHFPLYRSFGQNLIPAVSSTYYGGEVLTNCTKSAITYGIDSDGHAYGETTITPNNVTAGSYKFELLPDVGTNGGRTAVGGTFVANELLQARVLLTVDDGAGGASVVNNVAVLAFCSYIGGSPSLQQISHGQTTQGTTAFAEADTKAPYIVQPLKMTGDSSLIGAPAAGSGLRMFIQIYFPITPTPFRVRWSAAEFRKIATI